MDYELQSPRRIDSRQRLRDGLQALQTIDRACREWGFFQVTGHGINDDVISNLFEAAAEFFAQPTEVKRRILHTADNPWGYFDQELTKNTLDWKLIFDFGPAGGQQLVPQWPNRLPQFEPAVRAHHDACEQLAHRLLATISVNLGMPANLLLNVFSESHTSFMRLNYYPRYPTSVSAHRKPFGINQHSDAGALTLLLQGQQPGLEVWRDG